MNLVRIMFNGLRHMFVKAKIIVIERIYHGSRILVEILLSNEFSYGA